MAEKTFEQFLDALAENETLRIRMSEEMDAAALVSLGAEHGYEFTVDDLTSLSELELDESELSQIAGGGSARFRRARVLKYRGRGGIEQAKGGGRLGYHRWQPSPSLIAISPPAP